MDWRAKIWGRYYASKYAWNTERIRKYPRFLFGMTRDLDELKPAKQTDAEDHVSSNRGRALNKLENQNREVLRSKDVNRLN
ncbi:hypothetical protein NBRC116493_19210 [Aurantivibrio infirmus]